MASSVEEIVREIIVEQLGVNAEQVVPEAKFVEDLGADSLDTVELVMALEEKFDAEIPDEEAEKLTTVGEAIAWVREQMQTAEGLTKKYTFSGAIYFERMKELGTYTTDVATIRQRVDKVGFSGFFAQKVQ